MVNATSTRSAPAAEPAQQTRRASGFKRFVLMIGIPVLAVIVAAAFYLRGGRYITSENAYIKMDIIAVSADVDGRALPGIVKNNQLIKKNDILFSIDPVDYDLSVSRAKAALDLVRADVETMRAEHNEVQLSIDEAQDRINYYQRQYRRYQSLSKEGIGSTQAADDALFNLRAARQRTKVLTEQSNRMLTSFNGDATLPVEQHPAYIQASLQYQAAVTERNKTTVRAPVSGIVSNVSLQAGEYVEAGTPIFSLVENSKVWIEANLKETQLTHVTEGQQATITVDAFPHIQWQATVATIAPITGAEFALLPPQNATGNWVKVVQRVPVNLTLNIDESKPALRAGMTATVRIDTKHRRGVPSAFEPFVNWLRPRRAADEPLAALHAAELPPTTTTVSTDHQSDEIESIGILTENKIRALSSDLFTLQVGTSTDTKWLIELARSLPEDTSAMMYFHHYNKLNEKNYALSVGLYTSPSSASAALASLPDGLTRYNPWIRQVREVQNALTPN